MDLISFWVVAHDNCTDKIQRMATQTPEKIPQRPMEPPQEEGAGTTVLERRTQRTEPPQMFQVVMLNDDYTPMEFVVIVIQEFFSKDLNRPRRSCSKFTWMAAVSAVCTAATWRRPRWIKSLVLHARQATLQCISEPVPTRI